MRDDKEDGEESQVRQSSGIHSTNIKAYMLATLSSICMVLMQINLKQLTKHFSPPLVLGVRGSFLFLFNLAYLVYSGQQIHSRDPSLFLAIIKRALASSITVIMYLSAIKFIPLGIANALFNTTPIMTFFVEVVYYRKGSVHWFNLLMIVVSFLGVLLIIQPAFLFGGSTPDHYVYYFVVLVSAFTGSFSMIFLHDLRGKVPQLIVLQHGYLIQSVMSYLLYLLTNRNDQKSISYFHSLSTPELLHSLLLLSLLVLFAFLTQYLQARAMYLCTPALIMPFSYVSVMVGFLLDVLVFEARYNGVMMIGMLMASVGLFSKFVVLYMEKRERRRGRIGGK